MRGLIKNNITNPFAQAVGVLVLMLIMMLLGLATGNSTWEIMASCVLFYVLMNTVVSLQAEELPIYFRNSIFAFVGVAVIGGLLSYLLSGVSIEDAGSIKWILLVFTVGYMVFLSITNLLRFFVELAQKQDKELRGEE